MIKQECIGIPDMILLLMNFLVSKKIKIKAEIVLRPGGAYFLQKIASVCEARLRLCVDTNDAAIVILDLKRSFYRG